LPEGVDDPDPDEPAGPGARFFSGDWLGVLPDPAEPLVLLPADEPLVPPLPALSARSQPAKVAASARAKAMERVFFMR
jgi:hypothetical protein